MYPLEFSIPRNWRAAFRKECCIDSCHDLLDNFSCPEWPIPSLSAFHVRRGQSQNKEDDVARCSSQDRKRHLDDGSPDIARCTLDVIVWNVDSDEFLVARTFYAHEEVPEHNDQLRPTPDVGRVLDDKWRQCAVRCAWNILSEMYLYLGYNLLQWSHFRTAHPLREFSSQHSEASNSRTCTARS
jgi:hypothetical protein